MKVTDLKENEVIHCKTEAEAIRICKLMHEAGKTWSSGDSYLDYNNWIKYQDRTCYHPALNKFGCVWPGLNSHIIYSSELFISN